MQNHSRPSHQRGDSPITRPISSMCVSLTDDSFDQAPPL